MPDRPPYHSANRAPLAPPPPAASGCSTRSGVAFVHDLMAGPLPDQYAGCDVLYADLPWRSGFAEFNHRADISDGRTYEQFLNRVNAVIRSANRPAVVTTGRHALSILDPDTTIRVELSWLARQPGVAAIYNLDPAAVAALTGAAPGPTTTYALLHGLARRYDCAGDFCCGYGLTGRVFAAARKRWVLSDHNPRCIGHIAATAPTWATP